MVPTEHVTSPPALYLLKAGPELDPLVDDDFVVLLARMVIKLQRAVERQEALSLRQFLDRLDLDWAALSPAQRDRVIEGASAVISGAVDKILPKTSPVFREAARTIIPPTRQRTVDRDKLKIDTKLSQADKDTGAALLSQQGSFIGQEMGRRADTAANRAKDIVMAGIERGLGRNDITAQLATDITLSQLARSKNYWEVVATAFMNRARTGTQLNAFLQAGVKKYRFVAVMDEVTTDICRYMNNRVFDVSKAVALQRRAEELTDADEVRDVMPWVSRGVDELGGQYLFYERGGRRHRVAGIAASGVGIADDAGVFDEGLSNEELMAAGVAVPPLHGKCRSTIVREA